MDPVSKNQGRLGHFRDDSPQQFHMGDDGSTGMNAKNLSEHTTGRKTASKRHLGLLTVDQGVANMEIFGSHSAFNESEELAKPTESRAGLSNVH